MNRVEIGGDKEHVVGEESMVTCKKCGCKVDLICVCEKGWKQILHLWGLNLMSETPEWLCPACVIEKEA